MRSTFKVGFMLLIRSHVEATFEVDPTTRHLKLDRTLVKLRDEDLRVLGPPEE